MLTAAAVAVAVAASALACWLITQNQLMNQLNQSLRTSDANQQVLRVLSQIGSCQSKPLTGDAALKAGGPGFNPTKFSVQLVVASGQTCWIMGDETIPVKDTDTQIAATATSLGSGPTGNHGSGGSGHAGSQGSQGSMHTVTTKSGTELEVFTKAANPQVTALVGQGAAVMVASPLSSVTDPLNTLALVMAIVTGAGVLVAATAGLVIARAGLKPVDRLTATVERIARTEDLSIRIPIDGEDEIARLGASFNSMTARLAASRELQQQLIADAGHELRTPLTSLRTNVELLERSEATGRALPPEDREALLDSVKAQMSELASLIGDLQELSRPDTNPAGSPLQVVAFHEVTEIALQRARLRAQDIKILADVTPWYVKAEPAALERAIVNLLDNAVKFSPPQGTVEVNLYGGELTVRDHGPGIAPEELPHVFERFWRSTSARALPGSGLGLSIVARTVQQAGGVVGLHRAHGGGTMAVMRLPGSSVPPPEL
jgi:two-component system sensor histidine kinase MprB